MQYYNPRTGQYGYCSRSEFDGKDHSELDGDSIALLLLFAVGGFCMILCLLGVI